MIVQADCISVVTPISCELLEPFLQLKHNSRSRELVGTTHTLICIKSLDERQIMLAIAISRPFLM